MRTRGLIRLTNNLLLQIRQHEVITQEVVVMNPEEESGKFPTNPEGETTTTPEIITRVEEEMKEGPVLPLGFTSL